MKKLGMTTLSETRNWKPASRLGALAAGALVGAAITLGTAMPASATVVYFTFEGTVVHSGLTFNGNPSTVDTTGLFGGGDLGGTPYTATFAFDVDPSLGYYYSQSSTGVSIHGGSLYGNSSPLVFSGASVTIGATTVTVDGAFESTLFTLNHDLAGQTAIATSAGEGADASHETTLWQTMTNFNGAGGFPADPVQTDYFYSFDPLTDPDLTYGALQTPEGFLYLTPTSVHISTTAPAIEPPPVGETPLPASLPLFATGLGALGLMARRRKRKAQE